MAAGTCEDRQEKIRLPDYLVTEACFLDVPGLNLMQATQATQIEWTIDRKMP
jgi:hypothetical protein